MDNWTTPFVATALLQNATLALGLGVSLALAAPARLEQVVIGCLLGIPLLTVVSALSYLLDVLWLHPQGWEVLRLPLVMGLTALLAQAAALMLRRQSGAVHRAGRTDPWLSLYWTLLGIALVLAPPPRSLGSALGMGMGTAGGAALVLIPFAALTAHLAAAAVPAPFRGLPIALVSLGVIALAFLGFNGLVKV
ncbi:Rnf-Nqr domain containing protein [Candidatus Macondimonas diazotrophica]|jgi:electron transport complex protein RnfA|uniref:Uncharacterized protein n=1 Tax=Candidatus Macondimonas diazotrophica TaxID=2305248 RepID=A0A4Z0FCI6_9GAMM|nr:Rnf-Nqr domain containing protein [Candidatus Macondimonas diazotrophica]HAV77458.1 hypothetical protein [Anaerolineae bacterium]HBG31059.1 hypothetical protein [Gammaproteobacteria bacterium]NCU00634.1 hypothetical protein [Candidatus Macondimonas diazotrophica]TFZ83571.1 hypothetical protein E4680_03475 [Candidatus Macondimonas diazotrophica]HBG50663.1 hypothetical protein [Gammaproteobacteria bacterium]